MKVHECMFILICRSVKTRGANAGGGRRNVADGFLNIESCVTHASGAESVPVSSEDVVAEDNGEVPGHELLLRYC